jgi:hypothetical protein
MFTNLSLSLSHSLSHFLLSFSLSFLFYCSELHVNLHVGMDRTLICFVYPKLSSAFVSAPYENQFLVVGDVGGLYVIVHGLC